MRYRMRVLALATAALVLGGALAQLAVPRKFGVVTVSAAPSGACTSAADSQFRRVKGTGEVYACISSTWTRVDLADCGGVPSGACTGTAACLEAGALYACNAGTWQAATGTPAEVDTDSDGTPELYGTAGTVQIDSRLGIGGAADSSRSLRVYQQADAEGIALYGYDDKSADYLHLYMDGNGLARFQTDTSMQFLVSDSFYFHTSNTFYLDLNTAGKAFTIRDVTNTPVATIDSYGDATFDGTATLGGLTCTGCVDTADIADESVNAAKGPQKPYYGWTANKKHLCWDLGGGQDDAADGTCDAFWDDALGVVRPDGTPFFEGPVSVFANYSDQHGGAGPDDNGDGTIDSNDTSDQAWMVLECAKYGIPCGFNIQQAYSGYGWTASSIQAAYDKGMSLGTHSVYHGGIGVADADWNDEFGTTDYDCLNNTGTVTTDGSTTTVTGGGGASFGRTWGTDRFAELGSLIVIDTDGDGTPEYGDPGNDGTQDDFETYITAWNSSTSIEVNDTPPACTNCAFRITCSWRQSRDTIKDSCDVIDAGISDPNWRCKWVGGPGGWGPASDLPAILAERDIVLNGAQWDGRTLTEMENYGAPVGNYANRFHINCDSTWAGLKSIIDTAVEAKDSLLFSGHTAEPQATCTGLTDTWSRTLFTNTLSYMRELMRDGKALWAPPDVAIQQLRIWGGDPQLGKNLIGNPDFANKHDGLVVGSGNVQNYWPWSGVDTSLCSYDASAEMLKCTLSSSPAQSIITGVRLKPGYYQFRVPIITSGMPTGSLASGLSGVRVCMQGRYGSSNTEGTIFWPTWQVDPDGYESLAVGCSPYIGGSREVTVTGYFRVTDDTEGIVAIPKISTSASLTGTFWLGHIVLVKYRPEPTNSKYGSFSAFAKEEALGLPQNAETVYRGAKITKWLPHSDGQTDTPTVDLHSYWMRGASALNFVAALGKTQWSTSVPWRAAFSPSWRLGYSDASTASQSCYIMGKHFIRSSGDWFSGAMCGESDASSTLYSNTESTTPSWRIHGWLKTGLATEPLLETGYGSTFTGTAGIYASGLIGTDDGIRIGDYDSDASSNTLRYDSDTDQFYTDLDGDATGDLGEYPTVTYSMTPADAVLDPGYDGTADVTRDSVGNFVSFDGDGTDESGLCGTVSGQCAAFPFTVPADYCDNCVDGNTTDITVQLGWSQSASEGTSGQVQRVSMAVSCVSDFSGTLRHDSGATAIATHNWITTTAANANKYVRAFEESGTGDDAEIDPGDTCWLLVTRADTNAADNSLVDGRLRFVRITLGTQK